MLPSSITPWVLRGGGGAFALPFVAKRAYIQTCAHMSACECCACHMYNGLFLQYMQSWPFRIDTIVDIISAACCI